MPDSYPVLFPSDKGGPPQITRISKKDRDAIMRFIETGSVEMAAESTKQSYDYVRILVDRPEVQNYIKLRMAYSAARFEMTEDKVMAKLNMILDSDGNTKFDPSFTRAIEVAAKVLKLINPSINIGVQVNNNPYSNLSDDELDAMIKRHSDVIPGDIEQDGKEQTEEASHGKGTQESKAQEKGGPDPSVG